MTNANGNPVSNLRYYRSGQVRWSQGDLKTDKTYTGQRSIDFGLIDFQARMMDPTLGVFISPDPVIQDKNNPMAWNRYGYVMSNPIKYADPTGNKPIACDKGRENCDINTDDVDPDWQKYKGCPTVDVNGKTCRLFPVKENSGQFHVTWYYTLDLADIKFYQGKGITVSIDKVGDISIPYDMLFAQGGLITQGIMKIGDNQYINYFDLHYDGNKYFGSLMPNKPPYTLYSDGAVGPSYLGSIVYIPDFQPYTPTGDIFYGTDRGGEIENGDLDIYMGEGNKDIQTAIRKFSGLHMTWSGVFGYAGTSNFETYIVVCDK